MSGKVHWNQRYKEGFKPWDTGKVDIHLKDFIKSGRLPQGKVLEAGCGTGTNCIYLAQKGLQVTGIDLADLAIEAANIKAVKNGVKIKFQALDFLKDNIPGGPFGFVFDRGCFHSFNKPAERGAFSRAVAAGLKKGGLWLSLIGSADDKPRKVGPPMRSALDIVTAVEKDFKILNLTAAWFDKEDGSAPLAWVCLMQKRG
jgi:SAM-dependent methyltransferase